MNIYEEVRSLTRISENFRKCKKPKSKWPVEFQLRVLRLIEEGYSPSSLSKKLGIPVQTYYHWRRLWKNSPKKNLNFIELPVHDNQQQNPPKTTGPATILFPNGMRIENVSAETILRILQDAV